MKLTTPFIINTALTLLTCAVLIFSCGGCNQQQAEQAHVVSAGLSTGLAAAAPTLQGQPWYVIALIMADIATSIAAAFVAYYKAKSIN